MALLADMRRSSAPGMGSELLGAVALFELIVYVRFEAGMTSITSSSSSSTLLGLLAIGSTEFVMLLLLLLSTGMSPLLVISN